MATVAEQVQQIYIGLLGRAADQEGATYWEGQINSGAITLDQMRANFVDSQPEYAALVDGLSRSEIITALYQRMFERDPEASGLEYWSTGEGSGVPIDQLSITFMDAALNADVTTLANKTAAAVAYTAASGANHTPAAAVTAIDSVGPTQASLDAALAAIAVAFPDPGQAGQTFSLTENRDTVTGTADNDTFFADVAQNGNGASANALSTGDVIDGGAGTDTLNATIINDNEVDGANAGLSINARTTNVEVVNLSTLDENVTVDAGRMNGVDEFWSDDSDANLILEDVRIGDGQSITKDITFGLKDVDQQSGLSAAFDSQSLTNAGTTTTNSQLLVRIADVSTETPATPLANVEVNLSFNLGSETVTLENVRSTDGTYAGLVTALSAALAADGYSAVGVQLSTAYTQVTFADNTVTLPFTAQEILLSDPNGNAFSNVSFTQSAVAPVAGGFLVAGNAAPVDPSTSTTMIETTVVLDNAGRGSVAGDVVIGGMSNSGKVVEKMNLVVDRDSKIDDLATASGMENNAFNAASYEGYKEIEITSKGANGELSIEDIQDSAVVNANTFAGDKLAINNADALLTLNVNIAGDVTVTADTAEGANVYTTGAGKDSLTVTVGGDDVDTAGEGFTANTASGDDSVTIKMTAGVSQNTMETLDNLNVNTADGNDNVNLDAYGNFNIDTGAGSDFVRINSVDDNGNATKGAWTIGDDSDLKTNYFDERVLYKAQLTVSFAGIEETVEIATTADKNFVATQADINAAIKAAVAANPELTALLTLSDSTGNQALEIESNVGGLNNLGIAIYQPQLESASANVATGTSAGEDTLIATADVAALRAGLIKTGVEANSDNLENAAEVKSVTDAFNNFYGSVAANGTSDEVLSSTSEIQGDVTTGANVIDTNAGIFQDSAGSLYHAFGATTDGNASGTNSTTGINLSSIDAGNGSNDVVVLHSDALSSNQLVINEVFGKLTVVNWHNVASENVNDALNASGQMGEHALDFSAYLNNQQDASTAVNGNGDSATTINTTVNLVAGASSFGAANLSTNTTNDAVADANGVNVIRFAESGTETFAGLTATNLIASLNDTTTNYGNLSQALLSPGNNTNLVGNTQNHIIMVENDLNEGEYKVFSVSSTLNTAKTQTATQVGGVNQFDTNAVELGTLDFGASINFNVVGEVSYTSYIENLVDAVDSGAATFTYDANGNGTVAANEGQTNTPVAASTATTVAATDDNTVSATQTASSTVLNKAGNVVSLSTIKHIEAGATLTTSATNALTMSNVTGAITISGTTNTAFANAIQADFSGVVSGIISDTAANLATLTETGNAWAVTVAGSISVAALNTLAAKTTGVVTATAANGTASALNALATEATDLINATVTDTTGANLSDLVGIAGKTAGSINTSSVVAVTGSVAEANTYAADAGTDFSHEASAITLTVDEAATGTIADQYTTVNLGNFANTVTAGNGAVITVVGNAGVDNVTAGTGGLTFTGGLGADVATAGAGVDTFIVANTDSGLTTASADTISGFATTADKLQLGTNGTALNFAVLDTDTGATDDIATVEAAILAVNAAGTLNSTIQYAYVTDTASGVDSYLVVDHNLDGTADYAIEISGVATAGLVFGDIIA